MVLDEDGANIEQFIDSLPIELQKVFKQMQEDSENGFDYQQLHDYHKQFEQYGYTFEYYLDAEPYNFRKINLVETE